MLWRRPEPTAAARVLVASAGTSDGPIVDECVLTLRAYGFEPDRLTDIGVAGLHRLLAHIDRITSADAVVVVAGMEGALASVIGGLTSGPVVGRADQRRLRRQPRRRHRAAGDARLVRQRCHGGRNRQRVWSSVRDRQNDAVTRTAWFHCFAGTAGDMTMAALVDAGADPLVIAEIVGRLDLDGYALDVRRRDALRDRRHPGPRRRARRRPRSRLDDDHEPAPRPSPPRLPGDPRADRRCRSARACPRPGPAHVPMLADVEGAMHRMPTPTTSSSTRSARSTRSSTSSARCAALESLGIERIVCSSITVGEGTVLAAHGQLPNPAPAVTELLARRNAPSRGIDDRKELATPTGVALMCALADEFGPMPAINVDVGRLRRRQPPTSPGAPTSCRSSSATRRHPAPLPEPGQPVRLLETNVDDATGEVIAHTIAALDRRRRARRLGDADRDEEGSPGAHRARAVRSLVGAALIGALLLRETGSLGLRGTELRRWPQQRSERQVIIDGHIVRAKVALGRVKVEYDDAAAAAAALGRPLRDVLGRGNSPSRTRHPMIPPFVDADFVAAHPRGRAGRRALVPRRPRRPAAFEAGHIAGAVWVDLDHQLAGTRPSGDRGPPPVADSRCTSPRRWARSASPTTRSSSPTTTPVGSPPDVSS